MRKCFKVSLSIAVLSVCLLGSSVLASVEFDGLTWYHSEDPSRLILNEQGHLVWVRPRGPDQVTVKLPEMDLSDVGDVAQVVYMYKTEGAKTGVASTDPTMLSGTGDIRIGFYDSSGKGHIDADNTGYRNEIWCGYLGYCARVCPHLPVGIKRQHSDAIPGKYMKRTGALEDGVCQSLLQKAGPYGKSKDLSGFGLKLNEFTPLIIRAERVAADTVIYSVSFNNVSYAYIDDDPRLQPQKIDAMALYFPNPNNYTAIVLAEPEMFGKGAGSDDSAISHSVVYGGPDKFCGWPANNGVWSWGNEILVGFSYGSYVDKGGHNIGPPTYNVLGRSVDGGETWTMENPDNFAGDGGEMMPAPGNINFGHPDFVMRMHRSGGARFFFSYDRGHKWQGPYDFANLMDHPEFAGLENTTRTDYIVNSSSDCFFFMSARKPKTGTRDRAFCARTTDGGKAFNFVSWISPEKVGTTRGAMPSTVRISNKKLVSALRRKYPDQWVDVFASNDNGGSWQFLAKVADTGGWNGNPPALARLKDGRLCCVYGNRSKRQIIAKFSSDDGATWGEEFVLRDDFQVDSKDDPDLGYPRLVQRPDGKLVAMYYWATSERPQQHIAATIWDPGPK